MFLNGFNPAIIAQLKQGTTALQVLHRYPMNEGSGATLIDTVGGVNGSVVNGTPSWAGGLLDFNGTFHATFPLGGNHLNFGISFWVKTSAATYGLYDDGQMNLYGTSGQLHVGAGVDGVGISNGVWRNIVLVNFQVYRDGVVGAGSSGLTLVPITTTNLGRLSSYSFTGNIRDFCIYNRALTQAEALAVFNAG
jgi:hypothetical protein